MEGGFYGIYGGFGSGKTLCAVILILQKLKKGDIVFSNIKLDKKYIPNPDNYYYFDSMDNFYDILAMSGLFAMEISKFSNNQRELGFPEFPRNFRPNINIFFDEMGIFANSKDFAQIHKEYGKDLQQYILQVRKLFVSVYLIIQRPKQLVADLRVHISGWYKFKPLFNNKFLGQWFGFYWFQELDNEKYELLFEKFVDYDNEGNRYTYEIPQEFKAFNIFFKQRYFKYYDDLYLNKLFETRFRSKFLYDSKFFANLNSGNIHNKALFHNKKIYESYFENNSNSIQAFELPKVNFSDNPTFFIHTKYRQIFLIMTKKYYFKNIYSFLLKKLKF